MLKHTRPKLYEVILTRSNPLDMMFYLINGLPFYVSRRVRRERREYLLFWLSLRTQRSLPKLTLKHQRRLMKPQIWHANKFF